MVCVVVVGGAVVVVVVGGFVVVVVVGGFVVVVVVGGFVVVVVVGGFVVVVVDVVPELQAASSPTAASRATMTNHGASFLVTITLLLSF